ncbi:hypothetical protein ACLKA6_011236 [Drosophila palustris]
MRTLIILTLFVYWGCFFVPTNSQIDEDIDLENGSDAENDEEDYNSDGADDKDDENAYDTDAEEDEDEEPLKGDEIDDTSDAETSFEITTPYNFLNYSPEPDHIQKYPRFAILSRNRFQIAGDTF